MGRELAQRGRPALDRDRLVDVALELLDEVGLDDLTMRRLADRLGVTAASLYYHVRDKDDLLALLGEIISAEIQAPPSDLPWRAALEQAALQYRRALLAHRDGARILAATPPVGPQRLRAMEALLATLRRAGFSLQDVADAGYVFNSFVVGYVLDEAQGDPASAAARQRAAAPATSALGALARGRLNVQRGAANLTVRADPTLATLFALTHDGRAPQLEVAEGVVSLKQRPGFHGSCTLTLNGAIPWEIAVQGGAAHFTLELLRGTLLSLRVSGGVRDTTLRLPAPQGVVPLDMGGDADKLLVERPAGSAVRVHLKGGGSRLALDGMRLGSVGGETHWESQNPPPTSAHYALAIGDGSRDLTVAVATSDDAHAGGDDTGAERQWQSAWTLIAQSGEYPTLTALGSRLTDPDSEHRFAFGLKLLLDGLEQRLERG